MEGVQSHLRSGLTNTLRGEDTGHLTGGDLGVMKSVLDLADDPSESGVTKTPVLQNSLAGQKTSDQNTIQSGGIVLRLDTKDIIADHNSEPIQQGIDLLDDILGMKIRRLRLVNTELTDGIVNATTNVARSV